MEADRLHPSSTRTTPRPGRRRVVLAEDDASLRRALVETLSFDGYEVEPVPDGEQLLLLVIRAGLPHAKVSQTIDLIVSDLRMPFCSGLDVLRKLRVARRSTPFVLMTGETDPRFRARAEELGAAFLEKPFSPTTLLRAARERLAAAAAP